MPIFISYSHQDKEFVDNLAANLVAAKHHVWIDRWELALGDSLTQKIESALTSADASRDAPDWRCIMYGAGAASLLWVSVSLLFSFAVWWLDRLDELYGPVSAIIGLMIWAWLSIIVVLVGAELDATIGETAKTRSAPRADRADWAKE